jgi:RNA polymerase sigma-70 factor (ECF subfamily)
LADEQELLRQARSLDASALETIFDSYYQPLYRYIYYHVRHVGTAEDLAADVFSRMLDQIAKGRGPQRHLRGWLYRVAHNLVVDDSRRRVHREHEPLDERVMSSGPGVETQVQASFLKQQAWAALGKLTTKQRDVIVLRFLEGQENDEIARILGMSVGAVKALQHRGLASMRRYLGKTSSAKEGMK